MLILLGEQIVTKSVDLGTFDCPVCKEPKNIMGVTERNYFTLFFIRTFPLDTVAEYMQCSGCDHAFPSKTHTEPTYFDPLKSVLVYLLVGYGLTSGLETVKEIYHSTTGSDIKVSELEDRMSDMRQINNLSDDLKEVSVGLSWLDKSLIVEAAYLLLYTARPIGYEEKLKVTLLANAMDIGLEGVNAIISHLQSQQYKGFRSMQMQNAL